MSRVICVTGWFDIYNRQGMKTGEKDFIVSHGINEDTGDAVILPCEHPNALSAVWDKDIREYVLDDKTCLGTRINPVKNTWRG